MNFLIRPGMAPLNYVDCPTREIPALNPKPTLKTPLPASNPCRAALLGNLLLLSAVTTVAAEGSGVGSFDGHADIGKPTHAGTADFDAARGSYTVSGGGANMWGTNDALQFVWKRLSGDILLSATIEFPEPGGDPHRKACLVIRQGLEPDAAYADAVLHGDGLTSLQYREERGGPTREIQANVVGPRVLRLDRSGDQVWMSVAKAGQPLQSAGGSFKLRLTDPVYVGLGVCAHDDTRREKAVFSDVRIETRPPLSATNFTLESTLETVAIASQDRRAVYHTRDHIEAPNWSPDGKRFVFNSRGRLYRLPVTGGVPEIIDTGFAIRCNNDHGFSPDGAQLVVSDQSQPGGKSLLYILSAAGGEPRQVTGLGPSYWHGWSPNGRTLAYCAERGGEFDVYTIPVSGGAETRLTTAAGLDDGPEYSPDGRWIYFNSDRSGRMQIWRMQPDGNGQEQMTQDQANNWFPHPSPDGKWIVFLSYASDVKGHPENKDVALRLMPLQGGTIQVLAKLFGGQGTINVPSWSPDSRHVAFVSYRLAATK